MRSANPPPRITQGGGRSLTKLPMDAASEDNRLPDLNRLVTPYIDGERTRLVVIEGAGHFFLDLHSDDAVDQMVEFMGAIGFVPR